MSEGCFRTVSERCLGEGVRTGRFRRALIYRSSQDMLSQDRSSQVSLSQDRLSQNRSSKDRSSQDRSGQVHLRMEFDSGVGPTCLFPQYLIFVVN